jgi:predicted GH43/DUF377 family glycosyl hydrolase
MMMVQRIAAVRTPEAMGARTGIRVLHRGGSDAWAAHDKKDPSKVLTRSREPLVRPEPTEREGYVPNVVYTCGALRQGNRILLPYAVSDTFSNFTTIRVVELLEVLRPGPPE